MYLNLRIQNLNLNLHPTTTNKTVLKVKNQNVWKEFYFHIIILLDPDLRCSKIQLCKLGCHFTRKPRKTWKILKLDNLGKKNLEFEKFRKIPGKTWNFEQKSLKKL